MKRLLKKRFFRLLSALAAASICFAFNAVSAEAESGAGNSFSYQGEERSYLECAPEGKVRGVIFMLHGYGSDGNAFRLYTGIDGPANERGYTVVYVDGVSNPEDSTSATGWNSGLTDSPVDDTGFLKALAVSFQEKYGLTRNETYAAGFSNGGFMMYRLAMEAQDCFSAVASIAGMMPASIWENRGEQLDVSLLQINGTKDDAVPMNLNGSAKFSKDPAIEDVLDYFIEADGLTRTETESVSDRAFLTRSFSEERPAQVWQILIKDGRHSWPEEKYCGFDAGQLILNFFDELS